MLQKLPVFILLALTTFLGACTSSTKPSGHLVIVGGGLEDDNAAVFTRFVELCSDGPIGIVPTASGDGLEAGEHSAARWRKWAGTREVVVIPLTQFDAAKAGDPAIITQIDACGGLWFTGGDQSRIVAVFRPEGKDTPAMQAVRRVLDKGGVVGGTSAGAAMMSDPMITGGRWSRDITANDDNDPPRVTTGPGLGLFTSGMTDQHFLERARMGRLIEALLETNTQIGYGVSENCALVVDRSRGIGEVIGDLGVCVVLCGKFQGEPRESTPWTRVSLLSDGDRVLVDSGWVLDNPEWIEKQSALRLEWIHYSRSPWSRATIGQVRRLLWDGWGTIMLTRGKTDIMLNRDELTRVWSRGERNDPVTIADLQLRIFAESRPREGTKEGRDTEGTPSPASLPGRS